MKNVGGDKEIVKLPSALLTPAKLFVVGDKVECNYRGKGKWYTGKVLKVNTDDGILYDILYDDGDQELNLSCDHVRTHVPDEERLVNAAMLKVGMSLESRFKGKSRYYAAKIRQIHDDGTVDLHYFGKYNIITTACIPSLFSSDYHSSLVARRYVASYLSSNFTINQFSTLICICICISTFD